MFTDPNHLKCQTTPGRSRATPCSFIWMRSAVRSILRSSCRNTAGLDELKAHYQRGGLGDVKVKKFLNNVMQAGAAHPSASAAKCGSSVCPTCMSCCARAATKADATAAKTLAEVRHAMRIDYFENNNLLK